MSQFWKGVTLFKNSINIRGIQSEREENAKISLRRQK